MECRLPGEREEIKHNPETTEATETVCSWRTLVWRPAACSQNYLRGRIKTFCHLTYLSPTLHRKFPELQSHYIVASSSSTSKSILGSLKQVWPSSLNAQFWILVPNPLVVFFFFLFTYLFALFPRSERLEQARILKKRLPSTGWFNFWKESEIARAKSGEYSGCSINRTSVC